MRVNCPVIRALQDGAVSSRKAHMSGLIVAMTGIGLITGAPARLAVPGMQDAFIPSTAA